jgi:hypothetical protein
MKAGSVRLGVTTTPEHAASASASSRTIGTAPSLIRIAYPRHHARSTANTTIASAIIAAFIWRLPGTVPLLRAAVSTPVRGTRIIRFRRGEFA